MRNMTGRWRVREGERGTWRAASGTAMKNGNASRPNRGRIEAIHVPGVIQQPARGKRASDPV